MKKWTNLLALALLLFCFSCNEMDKYYDNERHSSSVSVGNAWDYLSSRGNFTCFLTGVEKAGYESLVSGTGLATIFAPTDDAFRKYFKRHGHDDADSVTLDELKKWVEDMNPTELKNMITYHLLYYGFTPSQFMAYNPDGVAASQEENRMPGAFHKYRTKSRDEVEDVTDPVDGVQKKVFHSEKYIPVFTSNVFSTFTTSSAAADDYYNLYKKYSTETLWNESAADERGYYFRVSNAGVSEYGIITDNGYLYILDDVVEPLLTVHQALEANSDQTRDEERRYAQFVKAYDRFSDFTYDEDISNTYGNGAQLFHHRHINLPSIADEWLAYGTNLEYNMRYYNTIYAPSDKAMNDFFNKYWAPYYPSIDSVNIQPLAALLDDQTDGTSSRDMSSGGGSVRGGIAPVFPSNIQQGESKTDMTSTVVDWKKVDTAIYCSNGILYGVKELVAVPLYFSYVTAPAFLDPSYNMFLLLMNRAGVVSTYANANNNTDFFAFYPDDKMISNTENPSNGSHLFYATYSKKAFDEDVCYTDGEEQPSVNASLASNIVRNHFCDREIKLSGTDERIYHTTYGTFNYLYRKGDYIYSATTYNHYFGKMDVADTSNISDGDLVKCVDITNDMPDPIKNGSVYKLEGGRTASAFLSRSDFSFENNYKPTIEKNIPWELTENKDGKTGTSFYATCINSTADTADIFNAMLKESVGSKLPRYILFGYTCEATEAAKSAGVINSRGGQVNKNAYVRNLYVSVPRSRLADYPFPGDGYGKRTLQTFHQKPDGTFTTLDIETEGDRLVVTDPTGRRVYVKNSFPYIYSDCAIYILEDYLDFGVSNKEEK